MAESKVIIVVLRRPNKASPNEMRTDPFWEFGSFGCTGCHKRNLMDPHKIHLLNGARLAFAQSGNDGFKLVHLTPPIEVIPHGDIAEAKWFPAKMPFRYTEAPLFIKNVSGNSDFPLLRAFIKSANCPSWVAKFSSKFRSRCNPLNISIAEEIIDVFEQKSKTKNLNLFALTYDQALPYPPPKIDTDRQQTYRQHLHNTQDHKKCK